jgi:hypothetical protein
MIILGFKREKVVEGWRKLHNEQCHNLYSSPIIIRVIKLRSTRHVVHVGEMKSVENLKGRDNLEDPGNK